MSIKPVTEKSMMNCPNCGCQFAERVLSVREPCARETAIQECIALAKNIASPFVSPAAEEIIAALTALQGEKHEKR